MNKTTTAVLVASALTFTLGACSTDTEPAPEPSTVTETTKAEPAPETVTETISAAPSTTTEAPEPWEDGNYDEDVTGVGLKLAWESETSEGQDDLCFAWSINREETIEIFTDDAFDGSTVEDFLDDKCD